MSAGSKKGSLMRWGRARQVVVLSHSKPILCALWDGADAREAVKALIVANEYLESEVCDLMQAVSFTVTVHLIVSVRRELSN
jgi:hypothetical protein